jgi:flagellar hook-associated protein 2
MSSLSVNSANVGAPITVSGLASGLNTSAIISALMGVEREPLTRLTQNQEKLQGEQQKLQSLQSSLQQLSFSVSEFSLPSLFESSQTVASSEPTRVSASTTTGAGVGGHEVEVTQLANSAQRTFAFMSPAAADTITIDGHEFNVKAGASAKELASAINSESNATVYAAVLDAGTIVLSSRATGDTGAEFIKVSDPGGTLSEKGTAKQGKNAEYKVDGEAGTSTSNSVTNAIAGVTLSLNGLTTTGPVTINVAAPGPSVSGVEAQIQSFIKLYNSTIGEIHTQLTTKPISQPQGAGELATGSLFGDTEISSLLGKMRQAMYEPIAGLPAEISSLANIGISTGAASGGGGSSQSSIEGQLTLNASKLANAIQSNPAGVEQVLQQWSQNVQGLLNNAAEPGGMLDIRIHGDGTQIAQLSTQMSTLSEALAAREKALQATYAQLEGVISQNSSQSSWLTSQTTQLAASGL